ncbi:MAG: flagellar hook-associated protein FlgL [Woeseiaceae bacterium]
MRISTYGSFLSSTQALQRLQEALDYTQRQISSGRRILNPSDDPIGSARSIELGEALSRLQQFDRNGVIAANRLSQEEVALGSVNNVLQRVRELALQANNATQSNETRALIAVEMREQLENLVQIANQQDGGGSYIFSGNLEETQPVSRSGSTFTYNGDQGQRLIQIGEGRQIADSDPGSNVFFGIRTGNGAFTVVPDNANAGTGIIGSSSVTDPAAYDQDSYTVNFINPGNYEVLDSGGAVVRIGLFNPGETIDFRGIELTIDGQPAAGDEFLVAPSGTQNIFETIDTLATAIEQPVFGDASRAVVSNGVNASLFNIDRAIENILDVRTQVGTRLAAIDSQADNNGAFELTLQSTLAQIQDLDYAEAISRLSAEATTLEAAQQSFIRTQQLSLFNYF